MTSCELSFPLKKIPQTWRSQLALDTYLIALPGKSSSNNKQSWNRNCNTAIRNLSHTSSLYRHESSVKHVVIESKQDPVAGAIYNITPNGPVFSSLYELIQEAQQTPLIQNHVFNVQLTCSPPKVNSYAATKHWLL